MPNERILVVDDEEDLVELLTYNLGKEGFRIDSAMSGEKGLELARANKPDLVILDLMLPGMDGLDVCRTLKRDPSTEAIGVLMLSARGEEADIVTGLELGADDYITKPFSPRVLIARVRAVLRRRRIEPPDDGATITVVGEGSAREPDLIIHPGRFEVLVRGEVVRLTLTEFRVLHVLARRPGWVFTRYQIVNAVKGEDYPVTERSVDVQIVGLRRKLGVCGSYVETVRGVGYRFRE